jgi:hypothetical protein
MPPNPASRDQDQDREPASRRIERHHPPFDREDEALLDDLRGPERALAPDGGRDDDGLGGDDLMSVLDEDDLKDMEGPDA